MFDVCTCSELLWLLTLHIVTIDISHSFLYFLFSLNQSPLPSTSSLLLLLLQLPSLFLSIFKFSGIIIPFGNFLSLPFLYFFHLDGSFFSSNISIWHEALKFRSKLTVSSIYYLLYRVQYNVRMSLT